MSEVGKPQTSGRGAVTQATCWPMVNLHTKCRWCGGDAPGLIEKAVYSVNWITISHGDVMVGVAEASGCIGTVGLYHHTNFRPCKPTNIEGLKSILSKPKPLVEA